MHTITLTDDEFWGMREALLNFADDIEDDPETFDPQDTFEPGVESALAKVDAYVDELHSAE